MAARIVVSLSAVLIASLALASGARATTVQLTDRAAPDPDRLVVAGSMRANRIRVAYERRSATFVVVDTAGRVAGMGCVPGGAHSVRCATTPDASIEITGQEGADEIEVATNGPKLGAKIDAGKGKDLVLGGAGPDHITGSGGHDVIRGRDGADGLNDFGGDWYFGGRGRDILYAVNGDRDKAIDCGVGEDEAVVDPNDPEPRHCEKVE
jgi:Ca2+-binding RTX toxin-like protein